MIHRGWVLDGGGVSWVGFGKRFAACCLFLATRKLGGKDVCFQLSTTHSNHVLASTVSRGERLGGGGAVMKARSVRNLHQRREPDELLRSRFPTCSWNHNPIRLAHGGQAPQHC